MSFIEHKRNYNYTSICATINEPAAGTCGIVKPGTVVGRQALITRSAKLFNVETIQD